MKHTNTQHGDIDDIPVSTRIQVIRSPQQRLATGLSFEELQRLGSHHYWAPILDLPVPKGGDDVYPPIVNLDQHSVF